MPKEFYVSRVYSSNERRIIKKAVRQSDLGEGIKVFPDRAQRVVKPFIILDYGGEKREVIRRGFKRGADDVVVFTSHEPSVLARLISKAKK